VAKGATVLAGGQLPKDMPGQFYPPTVLTNLNSSMKIWEEEVFGPVSCDSGWACQFTFTLQRREATRL
jgi:acyl-CoA reductase-like NAD-dependent aldehyde dehydrogenase